MATAKNRKGITITSPAYRHLEKWRRARRRLGLSTSMTAFVSELILSQPIPPNGNGSHPVAEAERKLLNQEAHP